MLPSAQGKPQGGGGGGAPKAPPAPGPGNGENPNPDQPDKDPDAWMKDEAKRKQSVDVWVRSNGMRIAETDPLPKRAKNARIAHPLNYLKHKGEVDRLIQDGEDRLAQAEKIYAEFRSLGAKFIQQGDPELHRRMYEESMPIHDLTQRCIDHCNEALRLLEQ